VDEPIRNLLAWEIERARGLYATARPGIELVHPTSRDCLRTAFTLYAEILDEIERADYDVFSRRVGVGLGRRAQVGLAGLRGAWTTRRGRPAPTAPA
jgi:phytoene synthase